MNVSRDFSYPGGPHRPRQASTASQPRYVPTPHAVQGGTYPDDPSADFQAFQRPQFHQAGHTPSGPMAGQYPAAQQYVDAGQMAQAARPNALVQSLGAVLSLALIVGAGAWVWQTMQRDVSGVPVVRALEGPTRVLPDNPGGRQTPHQGLSVMQLAAAQEADPAEALMLAPVGQGLQPDDLVRVAEPRAVEPPPERSAPESQPATPAEPLGLNSPTDLAVAASPRPRVRERLHHVAAPGPSADASTDALMDDLAASVASSVAQGLSAARNIDVDPATLKPGTRLVQLGAYQDPETAERAWDQLARRFAPLLDNRGRVVEAAQSGDDLVYRLRAHGFGDDRDARRFCAALVDQQVDCIPVLVR